MASAGGIRPYSADVSRKNDIVYDKLIGKGSYGEVWLARWNGYRVAAKQIHSIFFENDYDQEVRDHFIQEFRKEWEVLRKLDHPNIVRMLTVLFPTNRSPVIVTELLHCDLECFIRKSETIPKICQKECLSLALGVAEGLQYLHGLKPPVVHRDLATKNILLTEEKHPKIADLGVAKVFAAGKDMSATAVPGTPLYAAPETYPIIKGLQAVSDVKYGSKVDIFSFGAVVLAIIVGHEPVVWPLSPLTKDGSKISEKVRRKKDIEEMGDTKMRSLVLRCLKDRSRDRPDAASIVQELTSLKNTLEESSHLSSEVQAGSSGSSAGRERPITASSDITNVEFIKVQKQPHYDFEFKTLFLGDSAVGKSCLLKRLKNPAFDIGLQVHTVGIDADWEYFCYDSKYVKMNIIDTAGQERFFSIQPLYFRGVHGIFLVFDVTRKKTFLRLHRWISLARTYGSDSHVQILLVGNKVDIKDERQVSQIVAMDFATHNGFPYLETSVKDEDSLMYMYKKMTHMLIHSVDIGEIHVQVPESQSRVKVQAPKQNSKCRCNRS